MSARSSDVVQSGSEPNFSMSLTHKPPNKLSHQISIMVWVCRHVTESVRCGSDPEVCRRPHLGESEKLQATA